MHILPIYFCTAWHDTTFFTFNVMHFKFMRGLSVTPRLSIWLFVDLHRDRSGEMTRGYSM